MIKRDETLPRVSNLIHFLNADEFASIPKDILAVKSAEGTEKHSIIENNYDKPTDNPLSNMFARGLTHIFKPKTPLGKFFVTFEGQKNGKLFTGKPDFGCGDSLIDYKFCLDLRPTAALQLVLYAMLILETTGHPHTRLFAFHYPNDYSLFIHKIPQKTLMPLVEYAKFIIANHEGIEAGTLVKFTAISRWNKLLQDYIVFEPVGQEFAPLTIVTEDDAVNAAIIYQRIGEVKKFEELLKHRLKQWMVKNEKPYLVDGSGVKLQFNQLPEYDPLKKAKAKAEYSKVLAKCKTGTKESVSLLRVPPKSLKQIN